MKGKRNSFHFPVQPPLLTTFYAVRLVYVYEVKSSLREIVRMHALIPHVFQQVTFGLVFKVQPGHLLSVCVFEFLRHFDLEGGKKKVQVEDLSCL